jgi:hypothetical protein
MCLVAGWEHEKITNSLHRHDNIFEEKVYSSYWRYTMKRFSLLLVFVSLIAQLTNAQQITNTIIQLDRQSGIVWSNNVSNTWSLVEYCCPTLVNGAPWNPLAQYAFPDTGGLGKFPPVPSFTNGQYDANTMSNLLGIAGTDANIWFVISSPRGPSPIFFRVRSTEVAFSNNSTTIRMRVSNQTANIVSNITLQVKNLQGAWVDNWAVTQIQSGMTTDYHDFVTEWGLIAPGFPADQYGAFSGSYQTTGQTTSVSLAPWSYFFTLVIDNTGYHQEW